ncbi:hypothetical protein JL720_6660 [Aureococcus anophagefferens]|nr:hypothetical protein JL720_6660 [Aureococcus anophagefferens]
MRAYSILLRELLPGSSGATAIALSVAISAPSFMNAARGKLLSAPRFIAEAVRADARGSLSGKRTLRAALSHAFAALHAARQRGTTGGASDRASTSAPRRAAGLLPKSGSGGDLRKQLGAPDGGGEGRVSFAPSSELRTPRRRAAAVAFAREASTALRDAMRRVRSPLGRFLKPQAVANMRHMLDEATICGQMAKRLRADELGERAAGLWFAMTRRPSPTATLTTRCSPRRRSPTATATRPRATGTRRRAASRRAARGEAAVRRAQGAAAGAAARGGAEASAAPSGADRDAWLRNGEAVRRLAELGWLRCSWLGGDRAGDDERRLEQWRRAAARARAERECDLRCRDGDYRRDCHLAAAARDVRAADVAWRALRASTRDAGWAPFAADAVRPTTGATAAAPRAAAPRRLRVATGHRDARGGGRLAPAPRVASHEGAAYRRREAQGDGFGAKGTTTAGRLGVFEGDQAAFAGEGDRAAAEKPARRPAAPAAPPPRRDDSDDDDLVEAGAQTAAKLWRSSSSESDGGGPSRDQCVAAYAVRVVTPRGPVKGELRVAPRSLYFVAGESAAELKKGENAPERWRLDGLTAVRGRRYLLRPLALEFFFATRREVFVAFESPQDRRVCWRLMKLKARMPLVAHPPGGTKTMRAPHLELHAIRLTERWRRRLVTNFEYVMALNTIAGRSYNDLAQYFVFPWIIADYGGATASEDRVADADPPSDDDDDVRLDANDSDDDDDGGEPAPRAARRRARDRGRDASPPPSSVLRSLAVTSFYRDLAKPVGALEPERLRAFVERYRSSDAMGADDDDAARFMYGSHYSSAGVVLHFLVRLEPFTSLALSSRAATSTARTASSSTSRRAGAVHDVHVRRQGLVPEFFYCPELFVNDNRYPLGELQDGRAVDDVLLPAWAEDARLSGTHAEAHHNVFHPLTYEGGVDLTQIADATSEAAEAQITHFGQTPPPLFDAPHPPRSLKGQPEVAAFYFKPAPDGYGRPFSLRLEFRKQLPSFPLSRARLRRRCARRRRRGARARLLQARAPRAAGRAWHGRAQYCLCLATPGNLSGLSLTAEPSPQQAYVKRKGNAALQAPHHGGVTVGVVGCSGAGDLTRVVSAGYFDGAIRCHGVLDGLEAQGAAAAPARGTARATVVAAAECGRVVVSGHADGTATVWVDDFGDMAAALASDDVLVAAADGKPHGGAAARRRRRGRAVHGEGAAPRAGEEGRPRQRRRRPRPRATTSAAARRARRRHAASAPPRRKPDDDDDREDAYAYGGDAAGAAGEAATPEDEDYDEDALFGASLAGRDAARVERVRPLRAPGQGAQQPEPQGAVRGVQEEDDLRLLRSERGSERAEPVHVLRGGELPVCAVAVRSDLDLVAAAYPDGTIALHTARRGGSCAARAPGDDGRAPRGRGRAGRGPAPTPRATPPNDARPLATRDEPRRVSALALSRSGEFCVFGGDAPHLTVCRVHDLHVCREIRAFDEAPVTCLTFSEDHTHLFVAQEDGCIQVVSRAFDGEGG